MPNDAEAWEKMMIETGRTSDKDGYWHYNPEAIENHSKWIYEQAVKWK